MGLVALWYVLMHEQSMYYFPLKKGRPNVIQSHPLCRKLTSTWGMCSEIWIVETRKVSSEKQSDFFSLDIFLASTVLCMQRCSHAYDIKVWKSCYGYIVGVCECCLNLTWNSTEAIEISVTGFGMYYISDCKCLTLVYPLFHIQWNHSIADTIGTNNFVLK